MADVFVYVMSADEMMQGNKPTVENCILFADPLNLDLDTFQRQLVAVNKVIYGKAIHGDAVNRLYKDTDEMSLDELKKTVDMLRLDLCEARRQVDELQGCVDDA